MTKPTKVTAAVTVIGGATQVTLLMGGRYAVLERRKDFATLEEILARAADAQDR